MKYLLLGSLFVACASSAPKEDTMAEPPAEQAPAPVEQMPEETTASSAHDTEEVAAQKPAQCGGSRVGAAKLTQEEADRRYGLGVTKYSEAQSSKERPIEVCGFGGSGKWFKAARCDDGSEKKPGNIRKGSVGGGGLCNHTIDHYTVECPEGNYELYMDMYMCGPSAEEQADAPQPFGK